MTKRDIFIDNYRARVAPIRPSRWTALKALLGAWLMRHSTRILVQSAVVVAVPLEAARAMQPVSRVL
ncbi:hypothetical protein ACQUFY_25945 (plasmid) [Robbsia andropogonis]|uniref:hypothetical protein n=1 Tax=Robbsia andropogonis TaxID=28092 RepID=UPI003D1D3771